MAKPERCGPWRCCPRCLPSTTTMWACGRSSAESARQQRQARKARAQHQPVGHHIALQRRARRFLPSTGAGWRTSRWPASSLGRRMGRNPARARTGWHPQAPSPGRAGQAAQLQRQALQGLPAVLRPVGHLQALTMPSTMWADCSRRARAASLALGRMRSNSRSFGAPDAVFAQGHGRGGRRSWRLSRASRHGCPRPAPSAPALRPRPRPAGRRACAARGRSARPAPIRTANTS